jgi:thiosulfate/3-mercaptopyruvate sulfurtransferase
MSRSDVLVDADWVQAHLGDPGVVLVEVDEDTTAYDKGHIANAVKLDWKKDLQDPVRRDFIDKHGFEELLSGTSGCTGTTTSSCSTAAARSGNSTPATW